MSIAPFLPGLPAPLPGAGTTPGAPPEEGQSAFGDALAAALAGAALVPAELSVVPAELSVAPAELGVSADQPSAPVGSPDRTLTPHPLTAAGLTTGQPPAEAAPGLPGAIPPVIAVSQATGRPVTAADGADIPTAHDGAKSAGRTESPAVPAVGTTGSGAPTDNSASTTDNSTGDNPQLGGHTTSSSVGITSPRVETSSSPVERAVVQQVFPEVTKVVTTAGNGTHRITLTLQPEQLGEVRVTLVVRDGSVHVKLAGGEGGDSAAVHRALASGAPELQRLLERTGAEARISVRDAFGQLTSTAPTTATAPGAPSTPSGQSGQSGTGAQMQEGRSDQASRDQPRHQRDPRGDEALRHEPIRPVVHEPVTGTGRLDRTV